MKTTIEMAREAGIRDCTCDGTKGCLERFAELVRADERARMATDLHTAAKLALKALEVATTPFARDRQEVLRAQAALREALAEPDFWEGYVPEPVKPAQPVATDWERIARVQNAKLMAMCDEPKGFEKLREVMDRYERTFPPAQRTWVGLTDKELSEVYNQADWDTVNGWEYERAIEAKLKEKNT